MIIYKTINKINGKFYIGKDTHDNPKYLGSGLLLKQAITKYGKDNFVKEILERCDTIQQLDLREKYWINILNSQNKDIGYNIADGGSGGNTYTEETKKRMSKFFKGRVISEETRKKMSDASKGKRLTDEVKKKLSIAHTGKKLSPELVEIIRDRSTKMEKSPEFIKHMGNGGKYWVGKKHTEETKKKLSEKARGRKHTEESKRKISETRKRNSLMSKQSFSEERREKIANASRGRKHTEETKNKMRGANNFFYGKHHSQEVKEHLSKIRLSRTPEEKLKTFIKFYTTRMKKSPSEEIITSKLQEYRSNSDV